LDIVANLVGILVILIMVVGVRARHAWQTATVAEAPANVAASVVTAPRPLPRPLPNETLQVEVRAKESAVEELQRDAFRLDAQVEQLAHQAATKRAERDQLQLLVAAATADLDERKASLDQAARRRVDADQAVATAQRELQQLAQTIEAVRQSTAAEPQRLHHRPTPLAKTVFGREEHFRLLNGLLVYVPINDIVEQLRDDAERKLWKLKDTDEITENIGPIGGFRVRYTMQRRERRAQTPSGLALRRTIELAKFTLYPVAEMMGEPLAAALQNGSQFLEFVRSLDPTDATITVWTYPDSFSDFRQLKEALQEMGFQAAARPMPHGHPIGGSPDGSRSAAE
jgi:hypothetical protein